MSPASNPACFRMFSIFGIDPPTAKLTRTKAPPSTQNRHWVRTSPRLRPGVTARCAAWRARLSLMLSLSAPISRKKNQPTGKASSSGRAPMAT
ncbi:hypothetical protein D3C72_2200890 [compost metagenome]